MKVNRKSQGVSARGLLLCFGVFLLLAGVLGWGATGFSERGKTAIGSGGVSGVMMLGVGWAMGLWPGWVRGLTGLGAVLAGLLGAVFTWRCVVAWGAVGAGEPKLAVAVLLTVMALVAGGVAGTLGWKAMGSRGALRS